MKIQIDENLNVRYIFLIYLNSFLKISGHSFGFTVASSYPLRFSFVSWRDSRVNYCMRLTIVFPCSQLASVPLRSLSAHLRGFLVLISTKISHLAHVLVLHASSIVIYRVCLRQIFSKWYFPCRQVFLVV